MTALIDVIFILLIFFMISTQFKKNVLPLELPRRAGRHREEQGSITLWVTESGMNLGGQSISLEELEGALIRRQKDTPGLGLTLACDRYIPFEQVVQVLDKIQQAGITRIGIRHDPLDS